MGLFTNLAVLTSMVASVLAVPTGSGIGMLSARDVVDPPIISPNTSTVWTVGETEPVLWNTTGLLGEIGNSTGMVVLGYLDGDDENEHLMFPALAQGFPLSAGTVDVTVPSVPARDSYIIVLFGDSGNESPQFTIQIQNGTSTISTTSFTSTSTQHVSSHSHSTTSGSAPTTTSGHKLSTSPGGPLKTTTSPSSGPTSSSGSPSSSTSTSGSLTLTASSTSPSVTCSSVASGSLCLAPSTATTTGPPPSTTSSSSARALGASKPHVFALSVVVAFAGAVMVL